MIDQQRIDRRAQDRQNQYEPVIDYGPLAADSNGNRKFAGELVRFDVADVIDIENRDRKQAHAQSRVR